MGPASVGPGWRHGTADRTEAAAGAALVAVVLLMVAMLGVAHGLLLTARFELLVTRSGARQLGARVAAEVAADLAVARGAGLGRDSVTPWASGAPTALRVGDVQTIALFRRLGPESWLLEVEARHDRGPRSTTARLIWLLDPLERVAELQGVVGVGLGSPILVDGVIEGGAMAGATRPLTAASCAPWSDRLATLFAAPVPEWYSLPQGAVPPRLGELRFGSLLAMAENLSDSIVSPSPVERFRRCIADDPRNWGNPDRPGGPCGSYLPVLGRAGNLRIEAGVAQGVLVVDGDLTLAPGARYYGMVLVSGMLRLEGGAVLAGTAQAAGGVTVEVGGRIEGSACWAVRALAANQVRLGIALVRPEPVGPF